MRPKHPKERRAAGLSRRDFLLRSAVVAGAAPTAGALLAACREPEGKDAAEAWPLSRPDDPVTQPINEGNEPIASGLPVEKGAVLKILNWDAFLNKRVLDDFSKRFDCKVEVSTFGTWDEGVAKVRSGQGDWDIYYPSPDLIGKLVFENLLRPLNHDYLPNLGAHIWPYFSAPDGPFYDVGSRYSVPYSVFTTGIGFRNDLVAKKDQPDNLDNPWDIFWNPKLDGRISVYDDWGTTLSMAMLRNGFTDVNNAGQAELDAARDALLEMVEATNAAFTINGTYEDLPKGIFHATEAWSGDMTSAPYYGKENAAATAPLLSYWFPEDKRGLIYWDNMVLLERGKNPVLAHTFLNYLMDPDVAFKNMGWVGYQHPQNDMVPAYFEDRGNKWSWIVYPNLVNTVAEPGDIDKGIVFLEQSPEVDSMWKDAWNEVVAG